MKRQAAFVLAKRYAQLGIPAFPIRQDKQPAVPAPGFKLATTDEQKLLELFENAPEECGVGLWPGKAGYVVLDVDDKNGHTGSQEWIAWQEKYDYVTTAKAVTASGGFHYWFKKLDDREISNTKAFKHIDIRADGGYVVAPGTYFDDVEWNWLDAGGYRGDISELVCAITVPQWLDRLLETSDVSTRGAVTQEDIDDCGPEMYELLVKLGAHTPKLRQNASGDKSIYLSRPGKGGNEAVSVGHIGYNVAKFFTSSWAVPDGFGRAGQQIPIDSRYNYDELVAWLNESAEAKFSELTMRPEAFRGVLGEAVNLFSHTEADPVAILLALLTGFGNLVGRNAYVENVKYLRQYPALFTLVVGDSGRARKSAAWSMARMVLKAVDEQWATDRMKGGFGSGQVIISTMQEVSPIFNGVLTDPANATIHADERLMIGENEFGNVLKTVNSENSVYSEVLRNGYDSEKLENRTKGKGSFVIPEGSYHLSLFANITGEELQALMNKTELYNGFGNRFLYTWATSKKLVAFSDGDDTDVNTQVITDIGIRLAEKVKLARDLGRVRFSVDARTLWTKKYAEQRQDNPGGVLNTIISRSDNHSVRLALIYALLDGSKTVEVEHLNAALAVWDYCRATAAHIFKDRPAVQKSDSAKRDRLKIRITEYLYQNGEVGKTQLKKGSTSHSNESEFQAAVDELCEQGVITAKWVKTAGADSQKFSLVKEAQ